MSNKPIMAKATAVWLVDNTTITFKQVADFCGLHELEVQGIADGDVATGVKGFDPVANNQLDQSEIDKAEANPLHKLKLKFYAAAVGEEKRRGPRYTPLSKRQDRPNSILWLVKFHPELSDGQIAKLVGTTKPTIQSIRERTHWNIQNMEPIDRWPLVCVNSRNWTSQFRKPRNPPLPCLMMNAASWCRPSRACRWMRNPRCRRPSKDLKPSRCLKSPRKRRKRCWTPTASSTCRLGMTRKTTTSKSAPFGETRNQMQTPARTFRCRGFLLLTRD